MDVELIPIVHRPKLVSIVSVRILVSLKRVEPTPFARSISIAPSASVQNVTKAILTALVACLNVWSTKTVPALWLVVKRTAVTLAIVHPTPNVPLSITYPNVLAQLVTRENPTPPEDASYQVTCH